MLQQVQIVVVMLVHATGVLHPQVRNVKHALLCVCPSVPD
jgi:hypothetical protein